MRNIFRWLIASLLALGAAGGVSAQTQEKGTSAQDETKMDAKGKPGSPDTQSGKTSEEAEETRASGASGASEGSGASGTSGTSAASGTPSPSAAEAAKKPDETKLDAKGKPGSPDTQSGRSPPAEK